MRIRILGSGSSGNGYIVGDDNEQLIIECGVPFKELEKAMGFKLTNIVGCLCSHEHGDHLGYGKQYIAHFPIYATTGTLKAKGLITHPNAHPIGYMRLFRVGNFNVLAFKTEHDAAEPCGFIIQLPDRSKMMFATDTYYLHYTFTGINYWLLECNYDLQLLRKNVLDGTIHPKVAERVQRSHMSLAQCIDTLHSNDLSKTKEIMLIHLSSQNSIKQLFVDEVSKATGKFVLAAEKGLQVELM